jgi:putative transposase
MQRRVTGRAEPARRELYRRCAEPDMARRRHLHRDRSGMALLAAVMDLYSRRIVGWAMKDHLRTELPLAALRMVISTPRPGAGLIHHSDRGVQYASGYRKVMQAAGFQASMSGRADCYHNAPMESFFHTLKTELVHHRNMRHRQKPLAISCLH